MPYLRHQNASVTSESEQTNKWAAKCSNKNTEITAFVYEAKKFQTSLQVISVASKPNKKGTMGQKSDPSSSCF